MRSVHRSDNVRSIDASDSLLRSTASWEGRVVRPICRIAQIECFHFPLVRIGIPAICLFNMPTLLELTLPLASKRVINSRELATILQTQQLLYAVGPLEYKSARTHCNTDSPPAREKPQHAHARLTPYTNLFHLPTSLLTCLILLPLRTMLRLLVKGF